MGKVLVGVGVGVVVGAVVAEIIRNPEFVRSMWARLQRSAKAAKEAFAEGYPGTEKPSLSR